MKKFHYRARALVLSGLYVLLAHGKGAANTYLPGGHIETGESAVAALRRELREELGVNAEVEQFLGCVEAGWPDGDVENYEINLVFKARGDGLDFRSPLASRENHLEFFWSPVDDLAKHNLLPQPLQSLVQAYAAGDRSIWWASALP